MSPTDSKICWPQFLAEQEARAGRQSIRDFYASQCFDADIQIRDASFVAMDFETTGLDPVTDEIVSIGVVPFNFRRIHLKQCREWFIKPVRGLHERSITIHGITHSQLDDAPALVDVLDQLLAALSGRVVVVHYKAIERYFLDNAVRDRLGETLMFPVIDTMSLETQYLRSNFRSRMRQMVTGRRPSVRLADCRERYGLPRYALHSARVDAVATAELLQAQLSHNVSAETPISVLLE